MIIAPLSELGASKFRASSRSVGHLAPSLEPRSAFAKLRTSHPTRQPRRVSPCTRWLRNAIPRVSGRGGIQAAWRAITGINVSGMRIGVSGGNRGGVRVVPPPTTRPATRASGIASNVEFEVQYAAQGFDDVRAIAARTGLQSLMLGGNTSLALGTTPTPTPSGSTTGGALAARPWSVIVVALALDGVINGTVAGGIQSTVAAMSQKVATASAMVKCAMVRGAEAHRLGWTAHELFGVHPQSGTRRVDSGGVLMLGTGAAQSVRADRVSFAQTSGYRFLKGQTLGIPIWEFASKSR